MPVPCHKPGGAPLSDLIGNAWFLPVWVGKPHGRSQVGAFKVRHEKRNPLCTWCIRKHVVTADSGERITPHADNVALLLFAFEVW